ncbi:methionyl-tRNA formyltransferase [Paenibacillus sp. J31TS4]|uniref:methionyl-tRNA formyltransferase n=1 Tax=Paenibacillus sp. J31TS4 TaxID=2807195 RepID=UPI001B1CD66C|nr:methionyl-tRNA formyltransferase [Paenibacillus sp. J31TS4]GIP36734.1 methionyl-tRNA formyltransferase [Paenibacillus sp. J31TS4]
MNIVFMGTPDFAVPVLEMLLQEGYPVTAVVSQPDRPKGRKKVLTPPPVKEAALRHGLPVLQPERIRRSEAVEAIAGLQPDLIVTAAYGQIVPKAILELPKHGCINVHASLLPKYRGGAPIQHAILNGEAVTGVTIMYMAEGLDTGDMLAKVEVPITDEDTGGTLFDKLSEAGADLLRRTLPDLLVGKLTAVPQAHEEATLAPNIKREDEWIRWERPAMELFNQIRGLNPHPGAFTTWNGDVLKIWAARKPKPASVPQGAVPGTVIGTGDDYIEVATGDGALRVTELQPAGKKAMSAAQLLRGTSVPAGTVLGERADAGTDGRR